MNTRNEGAVRAKGVLLPWQRRLYTILLVPLGLMAANSIYLVAFTKISSFFMAMLLMHLVLGVAHRDSRSSSSRSRTARGCSRTSGTGRRRPRASRSSRSRSRASATGVYMALKGATLTNRPVYLAHVFAIPVALVAFILHRRAAVHKLHFRRLYQWGGAVAAFLARAWRSSTSSRSRRSAS